MVGFVLFFVFEILRFAQYDKSVLRYFSATADQYDKGICCFLFFDGWFGFGNF